MRPTLSRLPLLRRCNWWTRPDVTPPLREPTEHQALGTARHAFVEARLRGETPAPPDAATEGWVQWAQAREWAAPEPEVPIAYDVDGDTARLLTVSGPRQYVDLDTSEIAGTVDAIDGARVIDWKFGRQADLEDAADNDQVLGYAVAVARLRGLDVIDAEVVHIDDEGEVTVTVVRLDVFDLLAIAADVRALVTAPPGPPRPGTHCGRCPAAAICPEADRSLSAIERLEPRAVVLADAARAAEWVFRLRLAEERMDAYRARLREFVINECGGRLPLPDGGEYRLVTQHRKSVSFDGPDGPRALDLLDAAGLVAREPKASVPVIRKHPQGEAILRELEAIGALREAEIPTFRVVPKKKGKGA